MNTGLLLAFWAMSLMFVLLPGADWAYAISAGVRQRKGVLPAVAGMLAGHLTATTIVASGLAVLFAASGAAMTALTVAGALYLVWLGVATLRRPAFAQLDAQVASRSALRLFVTGVGISLLNPKVFLLFLALLPQFTSPDAPWPIGAQLLALGVLHTLTCAAVYCAVGFGAAALLARRPKAARITTIVSGIAMMLLGVGLLAERVIGFGGG